MAWLQLLPADWQIIADLSFRRPGAWLPGPGGQGVLAAGPDAPHDRPDGVRRRRGRHLHPGRAPTADRRGLPPGRLVRGDPEWRTTCRCGSETIPVRRAGRVIAVVTQHQPARVSHPSRLELSHLQTAADLTQMIAHGYPPGGPAAQRPRGLTAGGGRVPPRRREGVGRLRQPQRAVGLPAAGSPATWPGCRWPETTRRLCRRGGPRRGR